MENPFQEEFNAAKLVPYVTLKGKKDKKVGSIKVAGPGAGNLTYVSIEQAGHMVSSTTLIARMTHWLTVHHFLSWRRSRSTSLRSRSTCSTGSVLSPSISLLYRPVFSY